MKSKVELDECYLLCCKNDTDGSVPKSHVFSFLTLNHWNTKSDHKSQI